MRKLLTGGIAIAAILLASVAGYRLGAGTWPDPRTLDDGRPLRRPSPCRPPRRKSARCSTGSTRTTTPISPPSRRRPATAVTTSPSTTTRRPTSPQAKPKEPPKGAGGAPKKILYYRNPMGLPDTSPVPKKDWMGMDYIPVYEGEEDEPRHGQGQRRQDAERSACARSPQRCAASCGRSVRPASPSPTSARC